MMNRRQRSNGRAFAVAFATIASFLGCTSALQSGQLTAGDIDDGLNFDLYLDYKRRALEQYKQNQAQQSQHSLPDIRLDRVPVSVIDSTGSPFSNAVIEVRKDGSDVVIAEVRAGTNGMASIFPSIDAKDWQPLAEDRGTAVGLSSWRISARPPGGSCPEDCVEAAPKSLDLLASNATSAGWGSVEISLPGTSFRPGQLDLALVLDTTGSMCDELEYLQAELRGVIRSVVSDSQSQGQGQGAAADVRVGLVAYRDHGDDYVVRTSQFAAPDAAAVSLAAEGCGGGGDYPEAMDEALEAASNLGWAEGNAARVAFLVADAPPHKEDYARTLEAALELRRGGVRVYGIAASGVAEDAEYMMRLMSLVTGARYAWLTDDSGIGDPHAEPKVVCYRVTRLDRLLVNLLRSELAGMRIEAGEDEVVREVGRQERGVCIVDFQPDEEAESSVPTTAPTGSPLASPTFSPFLSSGGGDEGASKSEPKSEPAASPTATGDFAAEEAGADTKMGGGMMGGDVSAAGPARVLPAVWLGAWFASAVVALLGAC